MELGKQHLFPQRHRCQERPRRMASCCSEHRRPTMGGSTRFVFSQGQRFQRPEEEGIRASHHVRWFSEMVRDRLAHRTLICVNLSSQSYNFRNKKLLETSASLLVTSALLVVTMFAMNLQVQTQQVVCSDPTGRVFRPNRSCVQRCVFSKKWGFP